MNSVFAQKTDSQKFLIVSSIAVVAFYLPLILNHYYYRDDFLRAFNETPGWAILGRPLGDVIAFGFTADWQWMSESSPFFLIISLCFLIVSSAKALALRQIPFQPITALLLVVFLFNPLFIECLLYRFDCIIMTAALSASLLAWGYFKRSTLKAFLLCVISLCFYQTFLNVFIALIIVEALYGLYQGDKLKPCLYLFLKGMFCAFFAMALYYPIAHLFTQTLADQKSTFIIFSEKNIFEHYLKMFENAYARYFGFLSPTGKIIYGIAILVSIIEIQIHFYISTKYRNRVLRATICSFVFLLFLPLCLGFLYAIIGNGPVAPRMIVAGILSSVIMVFLTVRFFSRFQKTTNTANLELSKIPNIAWCIVFLLLLPPIVFNYVVQNDIRNQNERDLFLVEQLVDRLGKFPENKPILLVGNFGYSPIVENTTQRLRLARHLVPKTSDWNLAYRLKQYGIDNAKAAQYAGVQKDELENICNVAINPVLKERYFEIYDFNDHLFVWLGKGHMCDVYREGKTHDV